MNVQNAGFLLLVALIPVQLYFNFYKNLSISIAQILSGIIFVVQLWGNRKRNVSHWLSTGQDTAVLILIAVMFVSIFVSTDMSISVKYFIKWTSFIMLYYISINAVQNKNIKIESVLRVAIFAVFVVSVIGIVEYLAGIDKTIGFFKNSRITQIIMEPETIKYKLNSGCTNWTTPVYDAKNNCVLMLRAFGTFEGSIDFGTYLGLLIPFFPWFIKSRGINVLLKYILMISVMLALFLSYSRSSYAALIAVSIVFMLLIGKKVNYKKAVIITAIVISIISALMIVYRPVFSTLNARFNKPVIEQFDRNLVWGYAIKMFKARPILGVGIANYRDGFIRYVYDSRDIPPLPAHNELLQRAAETGIVGLLAYLATLYFGFKYSFKIYYESLDEGMRYLGLGFLGMWVWYCVQGIFVTSLFGDKFSMMFWIMVGMNTALYKIHLLGDMPIEKSA